MEPHWVYVIASGKDERPIKIEIARCVDARMEQFAAGNPHGVRCCLKRSVPRGLARQAERRLHEHFAAHALGREWFNLTAADVRLAVSRICEKAHTALEHLIRELEAEQRERDRAERVEPAYPPFTERAVTARRILGGSAVLSGRPIP